MKKAIFGIGLMLLTSIAGFASGQDSYGIGGSASADAALDADLDSNEEESSSFDSSTSYSGDSAQESDAVAAGGGGTFPAFSVGMKLDLVSLMLVPNAASSGGPAVTGFTHPVMAEFAIAFMEQFSAFAQLGFELVSYREDIDDEEDVKNDAVMLLGLGARYALVPPRAEHAHPYVGADFIAGLGFSSIKVDGDEEGDLEDASKELLDHFILGAVFGIEYLLVSEFGIGAELGLRFLYNNLEDSTGQDDVEKHRYFALFTSFGLKFSYHF